MRNSDDDDDDDNNNNNNNNNTAAAKITEELSQPNERSDTKQDGIQHTKARLEESPPQKMEKQSNAWAVH